MARQVEQRHAKIPAQEARLHSEITRAATKAMAKQDPRAGARSFDMKLHALSKHGFFAVVKLDPAPKALLWI